MRYSDKYDWETREDADTLKRYQEIKSDPKRMKKAQSCIQDSLNSCKKALGDAPAPFPGRENPATIMKLGKLP